MQDLPNELVKRLEDKVLETYLKAESVYGRAFPLGSITFKDMGRTAGRARYITNELFFSPTLYKENVETFLNRTTPHEVAHLVCHALSPYAKAHGPEWRSVMAKLGVQDIGRCHSYDTASVRKSRDKFVYACGCSAENHLIGAAVHKKIQFGASYSCRKCKKILAFAGRKLVG